MRILLIGSQGQVGQELQRTLPLQGEMTAVDRSTLDLTDGDRIRDVIREVSPTVIVNAAAYTAVDRAETEQELAKAINTVAPGVIAEESEKLGAFLVHISTDYVFDGRKNTPYLEEDEPNPQGVYGESKLLGERQIQQVCDRHVILRTAWVYGTQGKGNFVKTMLRLGAEREEVRVVMDQVGTPTWSFDIAQAIAHLLGHVDSDHPLQPGIYHFTNSGVVSWYDFAVAIFEEAQSIGVPLAIKSVVPITTAEYPLPATRPAYSVLSNRKVSAVLEMMPAHWRHRFRKMLVEFYS